VLAVVNGEDGSREAVLARFGLAPSWAKLRGGPPLINARDDKLATSGAWKRLAASGAHRALIVADGYYEWQKPEDPTQPKQPFYHRVPRRRAVRVRRAVDHRHAQGRRGADHLLLDHHNRRQPRGARGA
jgi:putative SOS response-associated peptidase YedK